MATIFVIRRTTVRRFVKTARGNQPYDYPVPTRAMASRFAGVGAARVEIRGKRGADRRVG